MTQVNKIVKNLESKKLIKAVKSVAVSTTENLWFFPKTCRSIMQNLSKPDSYVALQKVVTAPIITTTFSGRNWFISWLLCVVLENIIPGGKVVRWFSKAKICKGKVHCMNQNGTLGWWGEFGQKTIVVGIWRFSKQFYVTIWLWAEDFCEVIGDEAEGQFSCHLITKRANFSIFSYFVDF